jgi:hypothetical protein
MEESSQFTKSDILVISLFLASVVSVWYFMYQVAMWLYRALAEISVPMLVTTVAILAIPVASFISFRVGQYQRGYMHARGIRKSHFNAISGKH